MTKNRLSKVLAQAGIASRRKCEELIFAKKVTVNGQIVEQPQHMVNIHSDCIVYNGSRVKQKEPMVYYLLNKPKGYVCSNDATLYKNIVISLFPQKQRLFTVGRLDKETTGLLIVTNDGQLAHKVTHPSFEIQKEYLVKTSGEIDPEHLDKIRAGLLIERSFVKPIRVSKVRKNTLKITVKEGKKHEVRILVEHTGLLVQELSRIRIGNLRLGNLEIGSFKNVTLKELNPLFES